MQAYWVGSSLIIKYWTRLESLTRDKHSSLLRKSVNYGRKKFHNIGPWPYLKLRLYNIDTHLHFLKGFQIYTFIIPGLYYKTFYDCKQFFTVISYGVCHCQSHLLSSNICQQGHELTHGVEFVPLGQAPALLANIRLGGRDALDYYDTELSSTIKRFSILVLILYIFHKLNGTAQFLNEALSTPKWQYQSQV